jgi:DNA polymerase kappa
MVFVSWITRLINDLNQIRTRVVTTQNYINSKKDILVYATKLIKAEMPLSLKLMG